jgi:hypothetical protein
MGKLSRDSIGVDQISAEMAIAATKLADERGEPPLEEQSRK